LSVLQPDNRVVDEGESEDDDDFIVDEEGRPIQRDRVKFNFVFENEET
jgi:hypothetical protein